MVHTSSCTSEAGIQNPIVEVEKGLEGRDSKNINNNFLSKVSSVTGIICILAGVLGILSFALAGSSLAAGAGVVVAIISAVVIAVGLGCLILADCFYKKVVARLQLSFQDRLEKQREDYKKQIAEEKEKTSSILEQWKEASAVYDEDIRGYEKVVEENSREITDLRKRQNALLADKKLLLTEKRELEDKVRTLVAKIAAPSSDSSESDGVVSDVGAGESVE
ncbi:hypothetical protein [Chlamydia sp.]|uniref:hypothetical protein n=1 Tax=Chlamydia sp. TaxID=35827 RepID=UPI0025C3E6CD|nr:hypothetical protein [Chlamydia sp.]MBQ8498541.1 hypothetical protein [Chlamydia sp.]